MNDQPKVVVLDALKRDGPTREELDAARSALQRSGLEGIETPAGMAGILASWGLVAGDGRAMEDNFAELAEVSPDNVAEVLNTYLRDGASAAAGPGDAVTEEDLRALYEP